MPIEIKEIRIKADIYPQGKGEQQPARIDEATLEQMKKEIKRELLEELKQKIQQNNIER